MGFDHRDSAKKYVRVDGDTLETIAQRETQGEPALTADDLSKFNFGTVDPDTVDEFLRDELGTVRRDAENHFIISANDQGPGELLIPKPFKRSGFPVDHKHVLHVKVKEAPPQFIACFGVPGITFAFDKSYVRSTVVDQLEQLEVAANNNPDVRIMIFGHTDKVGSEDYNKKLSERRAKSVFAFITNDTDIWEQLYNEENWGLKVVQDILQSLGRYNGPIHGTQDQPTTDAIKQFQRDKGLEDDGIAGPITRKELFAEYMSGAHDVEIEADRFMDPKHMGCGEFNPELDTEAAHEPNRRVMFYLFHKDRLPKLPCKSGDMAPCKRQMSPLTPRFRDTFHCSFYDSIARQCPDEVQPPTKVGTIKLTSTGITDDKKVSHGAPVALNDDHDCNQFQGAAPTAGARELEPIFDLDFLGATPAEDDLLEIKLSMDDKPKNGTVELKITTGADKVRIWKQATKGSAADVVALPLTLQMADLPKKLFVEGLKVGKVNFEANCTHSGGSSTDSLVVNVVTLTEKQGGTRRIIYSYDTEIEFKVEGAPANYTFEWDLDGDGNFNASAAEQANTTATAKCKYGLLDDATTVKLERIVANTRKLTDVGVKLMGGLVLRPPARTRIGGTTSRGLRIALNVNLGLALPAKSTAGLHTLFTWSNTFPVRFDATDAAHSGANRISFNAGETSNAITSFDGVGAGRRVFFVEIGPAIFDSGQVREDLIATVNHEIRHLQQHASVRDNVPANNVWRLLDNHFGGSAGYRDFRECEGHFSEHLDNQVSWRHFLPEVQNDLTQFHTRYGNAITVMGTIPAGGTKTAARQLLQQIYQSIPFLEMKRTGYDFSLRAPT